MAKARALQQWTAAWKEQPPGVWFSPADRLPPGLRPQLHFYKLGSTRRLFGLVLQCRTGHAFTGEYYNRFVPTEATACPCGAGFQTRQHVLRDCVRYDVHRHHLSEISPELHLPDILGTHKGIMALAKFISLTGAFTKTGDTLVDGPKDDDDEKASADGDDEDGDDD